jgi:hypothetical protein
LWASENLLLGSFVIKGMLFPGRSMVGSNCSVLPGVGGWVCIVSVSFVMGTTSGMTG